MSAPRLERGEEIVAEVLEILTLTEGLENVAAGLDARHVESGSRNGFVLVGTPTLAFPSFGATDLEWELHVIAGPADNYLAAWDRIDLIIEALRLSALPITRAEPGAFQPLNPNAPALPAYTLTLPDNT